MVEITGLRGTGRREAFTFTPSREDELIRIYKIDGCIGDTELRNIQIEPGNRATDYVTPTATETAVKGLLGDMRKLNVKLDDPNSDLWGRIEANNKGLLTQYHEGDLSSTLGISPHQHIQAFRDELSGDYATFEARLTGMQTTIRNGADEYTNTQLAKLRQTEIKNLDGRVSTATQTLDQHENRLEDAEGNIATHSTTLESHGTLLSGVDGRLTSQQQTLDGFSQTVTDLQGGITKNTQLIDGFDRLVKGVDGRVTRVSETINGVQQTVRNNKENTESRISQLSSLIDSKVSSSEFSTLIRQNDRTIWTAIKDEASKEVISSINLSPAGTRISGKKVHITGQTLINDAVIKSGHIQSLDADKITTGTLNAAHVRVINLDANNITGNKTHFVQSNWNSINDRVQITSAGIEMINSGAWRKTIYTATGLEMFRGRGAGDAAGVIGYFKGSDYHASDEEYFMDGFGDHHTIGIGAYGQIALGTSNEPNIRKFNPQMVVSYGFEGIQTNKIAPLKTQAGFHLQAGNARGEWASILAGSLNGRNRITFAQSIATLEANDKLDFYASAGARVMRLTYKSVDINGSIKYSSDARLKTNIQKSKQNSLSQILNIEYATFDWKDGSKNQFGFIAQQVQQSASELITTDSEDYLRYDETRYVHTIGHALQQSHKQLLERIENLEEENELLKEKLNEAV
nr:MAG TPA: minor structural protein [Caudoviricetes sp.]